MIPATTLRGSQVALFGLGGSGLATARALVEGGADVTAWDDNPDSVAKAAAAGIATADLRGADWPSFAAFVLSPLLAAAPAVIAQRAPLPALCFVLLLAWSLRSMSFALRGGKGQIPRAVVSLIAGASLVDALFISLHGNPYFVLAALGCFLLTLKWQRKIPGT